MKQLANRRKRFLRCVHLPVISCCKRKPPVNREAPSAYTVPVRDKLWTMTAYEVHNDPWTAQLEIVFEAKLHMVNVHFRYDRRSPLRRG